MLCGRTAREQIEVRVDGAEPIVVPGPVHTDPHTVTGPVDVVLLAVKDTQYADAAPWLAGLCDKDTIVCALQNGVEQADRLRPYCPESAVVPAAIWIAAEAQPDGWVRVMNTPRLVLPGGPGPNGAAATRLAAALDGSGVDVELDADFVSAAWRKLLVNAVVGFMVLSGRRSGATTSPRWPVVTWPNAFPSREPRARRFPTAWSTRSPTCSRRRPPTWRPRC